jgi:regulator of extracellular matrix RemA (YlzA/DUF370 family)
MPAARAEGDAHGVSQLVDTGFHRATRGLVEFDQFAHVLLSRLSLKRVPPRKPSR